MSVQEFFKSGKIPEAIKAASDDIKKHPLDTGKRMALCELLCFAGELEKADRELEVMGSLQSEDPEALLRVTWLRHVIRAEQSRQQFYLNGWLPEFLNEVITRDMEKRLEASIFLREGKQSEAAQVLLRAEEERPKVRGTCNEQPFEDLRDLDDLTSSFFEVLTCTGKYFWIPFEHIESIEFREPVWMRDLLWRRAHLIVRAGPDSEVFLPVLYAGAASDPSIEVRLGRTTEWRGESPVRGFGQRMFLVGEDARSIMELESLTIEPATP